jgi:MoxR-like ATPase
MEVNMKSSKVKEHLYKCLLGGVVPFLIGGTGVGKSAIVRGLAEKLADTKEVVNKIDPNNKEFGYIDFRLSLYESVDLGGLPYINEKNEQKRAFLGNLPVSGDGVLFFDEYAQSHPSVQSIVAQLIDERKLGEYELPDGWSVVCASNRASDRASSSKLPSQVISRLSLIDFDVDFNDWYDWALANDVNSTVLGYLSFQPHALEQFDAKVIAPQPCPRQWVNLSKILNAVGIDDSVQSIAKSLVGEEQSYEFHNFCVLSKDVPNLTDIVNGKDVEVVDSTGLCFATGTALAERVTSADSSDVEDFFENALAYIKQFPTPEFAIFFVRQCKEKRSEVINTSAYAQFKIDNAEIEFL